MIVYNHISILLWLSFVLSCIATPAGVIAGVVVGVFLALVVILVVIVAAVFLVHRRKTVPGMCLNMSMWQMLWLVVLCTHSLLAVQGLRLQRPRHPVQGEHCSVQCSFSAMSVSVWCMVNLVSTCAFPTAVRNVPLTVVKTPNRYVCMVCYCRVLVFSKP